jgi:hypothetical protein
MKPLVLQAALKIALLKEEFSEDDLHEASALLERMGSASALLAYLGGRTASRARANSTPSKRKPFSPPRSKALATLETVDPEKFRALCQFETMLQEGALLPTLEDLRGLGQKLGKELSRKKSRTGIIRGLISSMASMPLPEINDVITASLSSSDCPGDSAYQQLARFIVRGNESNAAAKDQGQPASRP